MAKTVGRGILEVGIQETMTTEMIQIPKISKNAQIPALDSSIDINNLKNYFTDVNTVSFWAMLKTIKTLNSRGYSAEELKVKFHQYLSLPFYLLAMIFVSIFCL